MGTVPEQTCHRWRLNSPNLPETPPTPPSEARNDINSSTLNSSVDFITDSPYDIMCEILAHLNIVDLATCFDVHKTWYNRLLQYPAPWRTIKIHAYYSLDKERVEVYEKMLPIISQHVQSLCLGGRADRVIKYPQLLSTYEFSKLRSLSLYITSGSDTTDLIATLYDTLPSIAPKLKELELNIACASGIDISLGRVLSICRQLTRISYKAQSSANDNFLLSHTTKLTTIELIQRLPISSNIIIQLLQHSPHLRHLTTTTIEQNSIIYSTIEDHCPELVSVAINVNAFKHTYKIPSTLPAASTPSSNSPTTLQSLILLPIFSPTQNLLSLLNTAHDSLRILCLGPADGSALTTNWQRFSSIPLPNLTYLHINAAHSSNDFLIEHLPRIIARYSNLETLVLERIYRPFEQNIEEPVLADNIFAASMKLKRLSCLRLARCDIRGRGFKRFMLQQCALRELAIHRCHGTSTTLLLDYIPTLGALEKLHLYCPGREVTVLDITVFTQLIRDRLNQLSVLEFGGKGLQDQAIVNLADCTGLHTLRLHGPVIMRQKQSRLIRYLRDHIFNVQQLPL